MLPNRLESADLSNHFLSLGAPGVISPNEQQLIDGRCMVVKKCSMFPLEVIVRGYITGTAWIEYEKNGTVHGMPQPVGLKRCQKFPQGPIYTPAIKAKYGGRDENISPSRAIELIGHEHARRIEYLALTIYNVAYEWAVSEFNLRLQDIHGVYYLQRK